VILGRLAPTVPPVRFLFSIIGKESKGVTASLVPPNRQHHFLSGGHPLSENEGVSPARNGSAVRHKVSELPEK
jgi:hypothetical protein